MFPIRTRHLSFAPLIVLMLVVFALAHPCDTHATEQRIVSLAPSNTSMLDDLRLGHTLVGITSFCERPENATAAQVIGTINQPNLEFIATLKPTLVVADRESNPEDALQTLEHMGITVLRLGPYATLANIKRDFADLASHTDATEFAGQYIRTFSAELNAATESIPANSAPSVFVEIWPNPLMTISKQAYIHDVVSMSGGVNPFAETPGAYPKIAMESVLAANPDVIIILTHSLVDDSRIEAYRAYPSLAQTRIYQIDSSEVSQPSLSNYLLSVQLLVERIHTTEPPTP